MAAEAFLKQGDLRSASLSARQVLQGDPVNLSACEIMADLCVAEHSPEAILWRQKLADLQPHRTEPLLELASTAVSFDETFIAEQALLQVDEHDRDSVKFHEVAAALAIANQQPTQAAWHFQRALQIEPRNEKVQLNLAIVSLQAAAPAASGDARATVERLSGNPALHQAALRALLADARRRNDAGSAMRLATELSRDHAATMEDRLLYLEELQHAGSGSFEGELQNLKDAAARKPELLYGLLSWMNEHGIAAETIAWGKSLPSGVRSQNLISLALAEAHERTGDWQGLRALVFRTDWEALEFLRCAFHALVIDETSDHQHGDDFQAKWQRAMIATHGNPNALFMLARLAGGWGWKNEAAQALWLVARHGVGQRPALKALYRLYSREKDTRELYRVSKRIYEIEPRDPVAKNNVAMLAMLLGEDPALSNRLAAENFRQFPKEPGMVSTYAYSLYLQNRTGEALKAMDGLAAAEFQIPSIAACYGVLLSSVGDVEKAKPYLDLAEKNKGQLFREETALVEKALGGSR